MENEEKAASIVERQENRVREIVQEEITNYQLKSATTSYDWNEFHKQSLYLEMLIKIAGHTDHRVNTEIDEAIKKLKELTYA